MSSGTHLANYSQVSMFMPNRESLESKEIVLNPATLAIIDAAAIGNKDQQWQECLTIAAKYPRAVSFNVQVVEELGYYARHRLKHDLYRYVNKRLIKFHRRGFNTVHGFDLKVAQTDGDGHATKILLTKKKSTPLATKLVKSFRFVINFGAEKLQCELTVKSDSKIDAAASDFSNLHISVDLGVDDGVAASASLVHEQMPPGHEEMDP